MQITGAGKIVIGVIIGLIVIGLVYFIFFSVTGSRRGSAPEPIWNDTYSLYILDPGGFVPIEIENTIPKEFLILRHGDVEISCGIYKGAFFEDGAGETDFAKFATDTIKNANFLAGCRRWQLDAADVTIGNREFYFVTLLIRRDSEMTSAFDYITRVVHKHEIERFRDNEDNIVRLYYTHGINANDPEQGDIYIFRLSGLPEDVAVSERVVRKLLASVYLNASNATLAQDAM